MTDASGKEYLLPGLLAWRMEYTAGAPCDSFWLRCGWDADNKVKPGEWVGFRAEYQGERVFTGVVDECEVSVDSSGRLLEAFGRGMAALLLDNEALGEDYQSATQADILRDHVTPYGITTAPGAGLPPVSRFSVSSGSSEWSVVYDFARYYGGVSPRFDRQGRLVLSGWDDSRERVADEINEILLHRRARRVITMPSRSSYKAMRYSGQFQLDRSACDLERLEITVGEAFCVWPGDLVTVQRKGWDWNGRYRAVQVAVGMDKSGYWSHMELAGPDFVV